jgi:hypothetical protein
MMPDYPPEENYDVNTTPESTEDSDDESSDFYLEEED